MGQAPDILASTRATIEGAATAPKAMLFLQPRSHAEAAGEQLLASESRRLAELNPGLRFEVAVRLPESDVQRIWESTQGVSQESAYQPTDYPDAPYTGVVAVTGPPGSVDEVLGSFQGIGERLVEAFDPTASLAAAGTSETMIPVRDSLLYLMVLRRREGDSPQYFHDYWRVQHTRLTMGIDGLSGYRQNHLVEKYNRVLAEAAGIGESDADGIVEAYARDLNGFAQQWRWEMDNDVPADELEFFDVARCPMAYFQWMS